MYAGVSVDELAAGVAGDLLRPERKSIVAGPGSCAKDDDDDDDINQRSRISNEQEEISTVAYLGRLLARRSKRSRS